MAQQNQNIWQLNELLKINHIAEKSYLEALEATSNEELKQFFRARAFERNEFCRYLGAEIRMMGGIPDYSDTNTKINWPDFKKILASKNARFLFTEINRIKSICLTHYNNVLNSYEFHEGLVKLLKEQRKIIGRSIGYMRYKDGLSNTNQQLIANL
ncbi:DUF2383 domain-containing protein [Hyunsoonleella flava]|uniref:DUF2383 domain-containing protein n=1 Tax=Hyunsoonleella flava TaxID=2527939 RepID=A0A4Q9F9K4_9FLAO|nr:DUF2383 domain-containing protein [Hyunsoonleella flava]TBM99025.1 DUF2383 domain-containing protein [Hyunsoonleella flava]